VTEDFSKAPKTIGELRAHKSQNAKDWTPRDALISVLRQIDSGEIKLDDVMILAVEAFPDGGDRIVVTSNTDTRTRQCGILARAMAVVAKD